jgi:hypothetical protein
LTHTLIEAFRPLRHLTSNLLVDSQVPFSELKTEMREGADGQATRHFTASRASHAVGNDHGVTRFLKVPGHVTLRQVGKQCFLISAQSSDQVVIFIDGPNLSGVRQPAEVYSDGRRKDFEFFVFA